MSARHLYLTLPYATRCQIDREVLRRAGVDVDAPADAADPLTLDDVLAHEDDPALVSVLRDAWWPSLTTGEIARTLDAAATRHARERELAVLLCAESVAHLATDPRSAECRRVRMASVRGDASWYARSLAIEDARKPTRVFALTRAADVARFASLACIEEDAWEAAGAAANASDTDLRGPNAWGGLWSALGIALRTLYPDPTRLDYRDALTRWDVAVAQARAAMQVTT